MNITPTHWRIHLRLAILATSLIINTGCQGENKPGVAHRAPLPPLTVKVATASETTANSQQEVVGTIESVQRATISAKVTGTIAELPVTLGSTVKQGDLLVKINAAEIAARLSQAETAVGQAKRNLEREERLLAKSAATQETVNAQSDALQVAKAAQNEARTMLGYATIRAPFSGLVAKKLANTGDLATVGAPLLVLEDTAQVQAVAAVPEAQLAAIALGDSLPVRVPAAGIETHGQVAEIAPGNDSTSRSSQVKLNLQAATGLRPGQFVRVILPGLSEQKLTVPSSAVSTFGQMERVFVVDKDRAHLRLIRRGSERDHAVEILSGLTPGEQVVIDSPSRLTDGQAVKVTP